MHWVASHKELQGDPIAGPDAMARFLPSRFDVDGNAIDVKGMVCTDLACPHCHLSIPRVLLNSPPLFLSLIGIPSSGKSYFLASMAWQLRKTLATNFQVSITDADPISNAGLNDNIDSQFGAPTETSPVKLEKTEEAGAHYDTVQYDGQKVTYPRPLLFELRPTATHSRAASARAAARCLCIYDNAGESFQPGRDSAASPVTRHLAQAHGVFFLFDPTQNAEFRRTCRQRSKDPQMLSQSPIRFRQDVVLSEAANRLSKLHGRKGSSRPLYVILTKFDAWSSLVPEVAKLRPIRQVGATGICAVDRSAVDSVSSTIKKLVWQIAPEIGQAAEAFSQRVVYLPVSATGCSPVVDSKGVMLGIPPKQITPTWIDLPLLSYLSREHPDLIAAV